MQSPIHVPNPMVVYTTIEFKAWMCDYILCETMDVIIHSCHNLNYTMFVKGLPESDEIT